MNVPPSNVIVLIPVSSIDDTVDINNIVTDSLSVVTELMVRLIVNVLPELLTKLCFRQY